ncbi:MAG: hypothetical protein JO234_16385, partial [Hyphomicrobiales bacterium]|nr:hypothetical protein [Hyphomicrobiales bacterium]
MTTDTMAARASTIAPPAARSALAFALAGAALIAVAVDASLTAQQWIVAASAGALGMALWRLAFVGAWLPPLVLLDASAFAIFAIQRNDSLGFWQLAGPWADVARLDVADAAIAYAVYIAGSLSALVGAYRAPRPIELVGLVAIPFLFKLGIALGADWHMAE